MRSGTVPRRDLRARRPVARRQAKGQPETLPLIGAIVLGLMILLWIAGGFAFGNGPAAGPGMTAIAAAPTSSPTPTLAPINTQRPPSTRTPEPKLQPTPTPGPTPTPSPSPTPTPSPTASSTATPAPPDTSPPSPTPTPVVTPTPARTAPAYGLLIIEPADGAVVGVPAVRVAGLAAPGSTITWDKPLWFDEHAVADANGYWSFSIALKQGDNVMTFRVADDAATARTITVRYLP